MLDKPVRARLRTLSKSNSDHVASHLVMAGRLVDIDPERAYEHARTAVNSAGRVDVVREALALTAYATGRYAEALREVRTVRRLSGIDAHPAIEADCERGLGRPERALAVISEAKKRELPVPEAVELTLVESGARADLGQHDAALLVLDKLLPAVGGAEPRRRLLLVRADRLEALGRHEEAAEAREAAGGLEEPESVVVMDLLGDEEETPPTPARSAAGADRDDDEPAAASEPPAVVPEAEAEPGVESSPEDELELAVVPEAEAEPEVESSPEDELEPAVVLEAEAETEPAVVPDAEADSEPESEIELEHPQLDLFADTDPEDSQ